MPEISLKEYFAKLNNRLAANAADEVIHHCRYILQSYPKNVTAYRLLGRGLVLNGRWDEGREALRRVLSVIPDDYSAHLGLSEANERMDRADEAIWHLERALEQRPNDKDVIEGLRALYRKYRHVENLKIQLTAVAVARQNLRGGNYAQAIDTLRNALTRMNDRLDLKLLLAQILWQNGSEEEAAEIALEVLKVLPDCLEANKIMAKLWLSVERPSDAQRFVNHLESVDPYLAVELVQGYPPDDDVFSLDELDYVRSAQSELASDRPDWLQQISSTPTSTAEVTKAETSDEWSNWASGMLGNNKPAEPAPKTPPPSPSKMVSARFEAMKNEESDSPGGMTDLFGKTEDADSEELSSIFAGDHSDEEDPMAWLHDAGVQIVEDDNETSAEPSYNSLFGDDDDDGPLPEEENPLAWLQSANDTLNDDSSSTTEEETPSWLYGDNSSEFADAEDEAVMSESLDWLQQDDLLNEALGMDSLNADPSDSTLIQMRTPASEDPAALDEPSAPAPRRGLTSMLQETNFDWTNKQDDSGSSDDEMDDWLNQFGPSEPRKAVTETPDWLTDLEQPDNAVPDHAAPENDEWFAPDESEPLTELPVAASEEFAWMSDDKSDDAAEVGNSDDSDWLAEFSPTDAEAEQPVAEDDFTWMATDTTDADDTTDESAEEEVPDWLSDLNPASPEAEQPVAAAAASALNWLNNDASVPDDEDEVESAFEAEADAEDDGEMPDWLSELEPAQAQGDAPTASITNDETTLDTEFSWLSDEALGALDSDSDDEAEAESEAVAGDASDWLSEPEPDADAEAEAEPEVVPDWLSELEPDGESGDSEPEAEVAAADDSWLNDEDEAEAEPEGEAIAADAPDWLSELEPDADAEAEPAAEASADEGEFTWMTEESLASPEAEGDALATDDLDWLSELEPEQASSETEPAASEPEAEIETDAEAVPDWLSELEPEAAASEPETEIEADAEPAVEAVAAQDSEFTWMMEEALANVEEEDAPESEDEVVAGDVPDWLSELAPEPAVSDAEPAAEAAVDDSDFTWMTEEALANAESQTEQVDPEFTWMAEESEADSEPEAEVAAADDSWLAELEPEAASMVQPDEETGDQSVATSEDLDWLNDVQSEPEDAESEPMSEGEPEAVAADDLGWLAELEPEAEAGAEPETADAEPVSADDLGWLAEVEAEPEADSETESEPEVVAADESWLSELEPESEADAEDEPEAVAAEDLSWLAEDDAEEDASEFEPEAMATGIGEEDGTSDDEFAWLDEEEAEPESEAEVTDSEPEPEADAVSEDASVDAEEEISENDTEYAAASLADGEPHEATPATNAPDWLNAMVPGLDVDYEAAGDEFADEPEPEAEPEPAVETSKREYAWLVEMVDEENAVTEPPSFVFSNPPAWLQPTNGLSHLQGDEVDDDLPDWPSDDADADVPEWLR
ncbi:MAG: tetratricopeptide repeat protein [Chloroflexi bacterium]|nr:tetratricopeptide repeat protein [Chloroflexota bacterium]